MTIEVVPSSSCSLNTSDLPTGRRVTHKVGLLRGVFIAHRAMLVTLLA